MKEFDLELAKAGHPVCTRDGKPVRIVCFDAKGDYPIVGLEYNTDLEANIDEELPRNYTNEGFYYKTETSSNDLMMVSELKESDDKRIKEAISYAIANSTHEDGILLNGVTESEAITWLKKQGEQGSLNTNKECLKGIKRVQEYQDLSDWEKKFDNIASMYAHNKNQEGYNNSLYVKERAAAMLYHAKKELEKQGEQKSIEKAEPKFKVGDWIMSNVSHEDYRICKILKIENGEYVIESIYGYKGHNNFETFDKDYHLWTINDAKDGDVLTTDMVHFIFKSNDDLHCNMYCDYSVASNKVGISDTAIVDSEYAHPATKEQHDLLFSKMKEAGYEWDVEKKELKKIGQTSAWSKEDEEMTSFLNAICIDVQNPNNCASYSTYYNEVEKAKDWLKSIKDRFQQQNK